jgi:putative radical SAM enzyme (TIGR03279 family)
VDFQFHTSGETELVLEVRKTSGEEWELQVERSESERFGLSFEQIVPRQCANDCIFCFCKGNPADARPSLFVRDEDVRLSFLYGNYTTLTSITEYEMRRIIEQRLSPQYVSVHATDLDVRAFLLGVDKRRADIRPKLDRLLDAGIEIHTQIVLCPGINDGDVLLQTIDDLALQHPRITSLAIVPLGLTRYNTDVRLTAVTPEFCRQTIDQITPLQKKLRQRLGTTFAFLGDEIYLRAERRIPGRTHYGDYPQIEDGIGMVRSFENDFAALVRRLRRRPLTESGRLHATILTGTLFAPVLRERIDQLNIRFGTRLYVEGVRNNYFGGDVSVAGLLTGSDVVSAREQIRGQFVIIPKQTLKSDEDVMLDGTKLGALQEQLKLPVYPVDVNSFARLLFEHQLN